MGITAAVLVIVTVALYVGQGFFNKLYSLETTDAGGASGSVFSIIYGLVTAVATLVYSGFNLHPDLFTLIIAVFNGITLFFYNLSAINAARRGPYTLQCMLSYFGNILIPLLVALLYWSDALRPLQAIGIAVMLCSFAVYNADGFKTSGARKGFFIWVGINFLTNGVYSAVNDAQTRVEQGAMRNELIVITYLVCAVMSVVYFFAVERGKFKVIRDINRKGWFFACLSSVCAAAAINLLMVALRYVPSSILYSTESGALLIINMLLSRFVLHDEMKKCRYIGVVIAAAALVLVNI